MKKLIAMLLAVLMMLSLAACTQSGTDDPQQITMGTTQPTETTAGSKEQPQETEPSENAKDEGVFAFTYEKVTIQPGEVFDADALPAPASTYTVPSCALEGTDNVYNYTAFEVTAFDAGEGEFVYSVYFIDPNITTPEGLALGDKLEKAVELYGENYTQEGTSCVYTREDTQLVLILQGESIVSIEYRLALK